MPADGTWRYTKNSLLTKPVSNLDCWGRWVGIKSAEANLAAILEESWLGRKDSNLHRPH